MNFHHDMSKEEIQAQLKVLSKDQLLDLLEQKATELLAMVDNIPNLILDGLEEKLPGDQSSRSESEKLFARLCGRI